MLIYSIKRKILTWGDIEFEAGSGPYGEGPLPEGYYEVLVRHTVFNKYLSQSYRTHDGLGFFIPIQPTFDTHRSGFGIHPDGGVKGTLGCIGFDQKNSHDFWREWMNTSLSERPNLLYVESRTLDLTKMEAKPLEKL